MVTYMIILLTHMPDSGSRDLKLMACLTCRLTLAPLKCIVNPFHLLL